MNVRELLEALKFGVDTGLVTMEEAQAVARATLNIKPAEVTEPVPTVEETPPAEQPAE